MRNRKIQRWIKENATEEMITLKDNTGAIDPTAYEAVKKIVTEEKKELIRLYFKAMANSKPEP